jgi:hypothetical protein
LIARYSFYCANSYFNHGDFNKAIKWYLKRLEYSGFIQEKYVSCLKLYNCYEQLEIIDCNNNYDDLQKQINDLTAQLATLKKDN